MNKLPCLESPYFDPDLRKRRQESIYTTAEAIAHMD